MAKKVGRKPGCTPERIAKICKAIADGKTNEDAAKIGGIAEGTFYRWLDENNEFREAVQKAKAEYEDWMLNGILDSAKKSLKELVEGGEYEEVKTEYKTGRNDQPIIAKQTRTKKRIQPNPTAVIFALCNRDPEHWQNRVSNELSGKVTTESATELSLANVPDELLAKVIDLINPR